MRMKLEEEIKIVAQIKEELNKRSAKLVSLMLSGSDLYGFASEESDFDLRGIFLYNTNVLLGMSQPADTIELKIGKYDIVLHEIKKGMNLAFKGNSNILEMINAEQIYTIPDFLKFKDLLILNKEGLYQSYKGLSMHNYKKFIRTGRKNTVKKFLYVYRGLMAGIYVLEVGKVEPNVDELNKHFKIPEVKVLLKLKREGKENEELPKDLDTGEIEKQIEKLFKRIEKAYVNSKLPEPDNKDREELNKLLIEIRKKHLDT